MQRTVCLPLSATGDGPGDQSLVTAFDVAQQLEARLLAIIHEVDFPHLLQPFGRAIIDANALVRQAEERSHKTAQALKERLEVLAAARTTAVTVTQFRSSPELAGMQFAEFCRTGDLCLIAEMEPEKSGIVEDVIFGSGGPVLVLPRNLAAGQLRASAAFAWDGSRAAARALRDGIGMLSAGAQVRLLTITGEKALGEPGSQSLVPMLEARGFTVVRTVVERSDEPIGMQLQELALAHDASLLVMGAYGHQRLYEFILGGATRSVLSDLRLPILMSH